MRDKKKKKDWRELAAMVSAETDQAKLMALIAELTEALDEYQKEVTQNADRNSGADQPRRCVLGNSGEWAE